MSDSSSLFAVSNQGKIQWTWHTKRNARPSLPVADLAGRLYVLTSRGCIVGLIAQNGREFLRACPRAQGVDTGRPPPSPTLGPDGTIYVANNLSVGSSGKPSPALEARAPDGWLRWRYPVRAEFASSPLLTRSGLVCSVTTDKMATNKIGRRGKITLFCLNRRGKKQWSRTLATRPVDLPLFSFGNRIDLNTRTALFLWTDNGALSRAVSLASPATGPSSTGIFVSPGPAGLIAVVKGQRAVVLNRDLQVLWRATLGAVKPTSPALVTGFGTLALPTKRGGLLLISPPL